MKHFKKKHNTATNILIKRFTNKKSGMVSETRREIQHRFDYLDWSVQKRIIFLFLESGKTDRVWAYSKMLKFWDDCFITVVKSHWEKFNDLKCSWLIIKHFPLSYVKEHERELSLGDNYYHICRRLCKDKSFRINKTRLNAQQYLNIIRDSEEKISDEEALYILYALSRDRCQKGLPINYFTNKYCCNRGDAPSPIDIPEISMAFYYFRQMGNQDALKAYARWADSVQKHINGNIKFWELQSLPVPDYIYITQLSEIMMKVMSDALKHLEIVE